MACPLSRARFEAIQFSSLNVPKNVDDPKLANQVAKIQDCPANNKQAKEMTKAKAKT